MGNRSLLGGREEERACAHTQIMHDFPRLCIKTNQNTGRFCEGI